MNSRRFRSWWPQHMPTRGRSSRSLSNTTMKGRNTATRRTFWWSGAHDQEVVEVKDDQEADLPENRARFALISELLAEHGYHFRVWTRSEICAEPRLTNARLILRYRCVAVPPQERERIRRAFSSTPEMTLRALCETSGMTVPSVLRLVIEGMLHIDWWEPLGLESKVSITPIGRQTWPSPLGRATTVRGNRCH